MASFFKKNSFRPSRPKPRLVFLGLAILMFVVTLGLIIYNLTFLVSNFDQALGVLPEPTVSQGFDIQGFQKLQLTK